MLQFSEDDLNDHLDLWTSLYVLNAFDPIFLCLMGHLLQFAGCQDLLMRIHIWISRWLECVSVSQLPFFMCQSVKRVLAIARLTGQVVWKMGCAGRHCTLDCANLQYLFYNQARICDGNIVQPDGQQMGVKQALQIDVLCALCRA